MYVLWWIRSGNRNRTEGIMTMTVTVLICQSNLCSLFAKINSLFHYFTKFVDIQEHTIKKPKHYYIMTIMIQHLIYIQSLKWNLNIWTTLDVCPSVYRLTWIINLMNYISLLISEIILVITVCKLVSCRACQIIKLKVWKYLYFDFGDCRNIVYINISKLTLYNFLKLFLKIHLWSCKINVYTKFQ